jgi:hypothetical protein
MSARVIQARSPRPSTATLGASAQTQMTQGVVNFYTDRAVQTAFGMTPEEKEARKAARSTPEAKAAAKEARAAKKEAKKTEAVRTAGARKVKGKNGGYTKRVLIAAATTLCMLDTKAITDRAEKVEGAHVSFIVITFPPKMVTDSVSTHQTLAKIIRLHRAITKGNPIPESEPEVELVTEFHEDGSMTIGEKTPDGAAYIWNIEFKKSGQAHINFLSALTDAEAYEFRRGVMKLTGWPRGSSMKKAVYLSTPSRFEEQTRSARDLVEHAMKYMVLIGDSPKALRKRHQYKTPESWKSGSGAMYGYSRHLKKAVTLQLIITNKKQRIAVDRYLSRRLDIQSDFVQWYYSETSEMSEAYDLSPFSPDRIGGSTRTTFVTQEMIDDLKILVRHFA